MTENISLEDKCTFITCPHCPHCENIEDKNSIQPKLQVWDKNRELFKTALCQFHFGKTCRILSNIPKKESIIELFSLLKDYPFAFPPKEMRKIAKKIKCPIKDFGHIWQNIIMSGLQENFDYLLVENSDQTFVLAINIREIIDQHKLKLDEFRSILNRFDIH